MQCLYCSGEHALPAAFGEFKDAPKLQDRVCRVCNNTRLGVLDEQFARCGPKVILRRFYGIKGRATHGDVNVFERGSAGGHRLDMTSMDKALGVEVALEIVDGRPRPSCALLCSGWVLCNRAPIPLNRGLDRHRW